MPVQLITCMSDYFSAADRLHAKHNVSNAIGLVGCLPSIVFVLFMSIAQ